MDSLILLGDARERLAELPAGSARTCVTSPPYFGLRDYGTATWEGGSPDCDYKGPPRASDKTGLSHPEKKSREQLLAEPSRLVSATPYKGDCPKCGANRIDSQMGLEETPDAYVAEMVALFREVWRVLADDGTLWLNLGDSYGVGKQLLGIPWKVAFALQADGWYLRSDIIWAKPNPMPESVRDRPTKSHEYLFLLTKSPKYYYDHEVIKEPAVSKDRNFSGEPSGTYSADAGRNDGGIHYGAGYKTGETRNKRSVWTINTKPFKGAHFAVMPEALVEPCVLAGSAEGDTVLDPFTGSGTVAVVANRLGRNFVGTELNPEYAEIAKERILNSAPMFNQVEVK
jgi:DNA modification methylase